MPSYIYFGGSVYEVPETTKNRRRRDLLVAPTGLEPVTQGSSGLCSTN